MMPHANTIEAQTGTGVIIGGGGGWAVPPHFSSFYCYVNAFTLVLLIGNLYKYNIIRKICVLKHCPEEYTRLN